MTGQVGINRPYTAPIYRSYREWITGLYRQGILGFYKGNFYRHTYITFVSFCQVEMLFRIKKMTGFQGHFTHLFSFIVSSMLFHPMHMLESRYILQNRITPTYKSLLSFMTGVGQKNILNGVIWHAPKCFALSFLDINFSSKITLYGLILKQIMINALAYPFITVWRRMECQANVQGMIPKRYTNSWHWLGLTYYEEGFKGLYRGFISYSIGLTIYALVIPMLMFLSMNHSPLFGKNIKDDD